MFEIMIRWVYVSVPEVIVPEMMVGWVYVRDYDQMGICQCTRGYLPEMMVG